MASSLDALTASGSQIVLASDRPPADINGLDARLVNAAGGSVLAHLLDLEKRGLVVRQEQQWSKAA